MTRTFKAQTLLSATAKGVALVGLAVGLSACTANNQTLGAGVGALGGALLGSQFGGGGGNTAATIAGGLIGAFVGSEIGRSMDQTSRTRAEAATQRALEHGASGERVAWSNPDTGYSGKVSPRPAYRDGRGRTCREYEHLVSVGGKAETATGVACRRADGSWELVS